MFPLGSNSLMESWATWPVMIAWGLVVLLIVFVFPVSGLTFTHRRREQRYTVLGGRLEAVSRRAFQLIFSGLGCLSDIRRPSKRPRGRMGWGYLRTRRMSSPGCPGSSTPQKIGISVHLAAGPHQSF
ncbi:hypothetical protein QBC47DRAFT_371325 [Echria macrotheca]|uniref:Uncharacterized protein n=1 Tax=Echria macrotheca TaxID=438768 RepID=A0AAJ0BJ41_9PEZI|nr:hypothetical protein QBC47DRAFT_371325 [Echria macrotheca]